ncbi:MAG: UvrD-helicase domain-containing protein [Saprospiraceae bacterium]|nr:UvrD-helicase domain-containing protein [Saprospiraceae bacterium]
MSNAKSTYLDELNKVQRAAVEATDGPVLVVAGPGSGKTRVLTYRIAHIIEKGAKPWEVLALTFTNKAAREMKERISKVVGNSADRIWAGTFHSIFARILRQEAPKIGYPSNFTIYDSEDTKSVIKAVLKEMNLSTDVYNPNSVRARISSAKSNLIPPALYEKDKELREQDNMAKRPYMHEIYKRYVARCKRSGAMDFDDLLYRLYELLHRNPDGVREKYQQRFKYVLVDEFQDTNHLQYSIVKKLVVYDGSPRNICVVGDDAQSIYAFRGATIQNMLDFENDFKPHGIQVFKLEQNYRSTEHIVQAANQVITNNRRQIQKEIWSNKGGGQRIKLIRARTDSEEGKRIADTILEQKNRNHLANSDIAILYRTNAQSRVFEEYLRRYNIAYKIYGGLSFYQRKEVKDLLAYFRLAVNPKDEEALRRVINYPKRAIGPSTVDKLSEFAGQQDITMWEAIAQLPLTNRAAASLQTFSTLIKDFSSKVNDPDPYATADYIARRSGLLDTLRKDTTVEGIGRLENVNALLDGVKNFSESDDTFGQEGTEGDEKTLASYIQSIALLTDFDEKNDNGDHVTLMSVHAAKGLEFSSVFVVGLEEKLFPSFMSMDTIDGLDEERRLFYVAITRAESFLTLTYADSRYQYGQMRYNQASRFLEEIDPKHMDIASPLGTKGNSTRIESRMGDDASGAGGASVKGHFKKAANLRGPAVDPKTFRPSPMSEIQAGMKVLHLSFGEGKVLSLDGAKDNPVATIFFQQIDNPQRRIMLKFAKLQVVE